eukprot:scaffold38264_cov61-Phaeocystis_antarctica.AAC.1
MACSCAICNSSSFRAACATRSCLHFSLCRCTRSLSLVPWLLAAGATGSSHEDSTGSPSS